jgi:hypothetical protein
VVAGIVLVALDDVLGCGGEPPGDDGRERNRACQEDLAGQFHDVSSPGFLFT